MLISEKFALVETMHVFRINTKGAVGVNVWWHVLFLNGEIFIFRKSFLKLLSWSSLSSSSSDDEYSALVAFALSKSKRRYKNLVKDFLKKRDEQGSYNMVRELAMGDREMYFRYMLMTPDRKVHLLSLGAPLITNLSTNYREPILPEQRLSLTLRHLATGESQISLSLQYRIGRQPISKITPEACKAIYDALVAKYVNTPSITWRLACNFKAVWRSMELASHCKHIRIPLYFTIINTFSAWFCSLYVMQSTASLCLTWASTVATMTAALYSTVKWAKNLLRAR